MGNCVFKQSAEGIGEYYPHCYCDDCKAYRSNEAKKAVVEERKEEILTCKKRSLNGEVVDEDGKGESDVGDNRCAEIENHIAPLKTDLLLLREQARQSMSVPIANRTTLNGDGNSEEESDVDEDNKEEMQMKEKLLKAMKTEERVKWEDVAGLEEAKAALKEAIILPIKSPHLFIGKRKPWRTILLYGAPGSGKSMLAKAAVFEAQSLGSTTFTMFNCDLSESTSKLVQLLFHEAREQKPSIIFIDDLDTLSTELRLQMRDVLKDPNGGVVVLAATNRPWLLDTSMLCCFEKRIYIPMPHIDARKHMLKQFISNSTDSLDDHDYDILASKTVGFTGSDLYVVAREAMMHPVRELMNATHFKRVPRASSNDASGLIENDMMMPCRPNYEGAIALSWHDVPTDRLDVRMICMEDMLRALSNCKSTVTQEEIDKIEHFMVEEVSEAKNARVKSVYTKSNATRENGKRCIKQKIAMMAC